MSLLAILPFVVLTMDQASRTHQKVLRKASELQLWSFSPHGIHPVFFRRDYVGVYGNAKYADGAKLWSFSGVASMQNVAVDPRQSVLLNSTHFDSDDNACARDNGVIIEYHWKGHGAQSIPRYTANMWWDGQTMVHCFQGFWEVLRRRGRKERTPSWMIQLWTLSWLILMVACFLVGGLFKFALWASTLAAGSALNAMRVTVAGIKSGGRGRRFNMLWLLMLGNLGYSGAVCSVCHGFFVGCTGGGDGNTCKEAAQVAANVAALAAAGGGVVKLVNLFNPRILRVFTSTVLGLVSRYKAMPVAGTPYDFAGKANKDVVADVQAGKVSKGEALVHFSGKIDEAASLSEADGRAAKTEAILGQVKLLHAMDDKPASSSSSTPLVGVHRYVWAKCSEVVMTKDNSKVTVGGTEKESTSAQTAKILTPDCVEAYFEILNLWQAMVVQTGLTTLGAVFEFTQRVVFLPMRRGDSWKLTHELLLAYLDKVDQSVDKSKTLGDVFQKEGVDAMKDEALAGVAARFGAGPGNIFRHTGGTRGEDGDKVYNGKDSPRSPQPCMAWNRDPAHPQHRKEHLHADGCCKFRHKCGQFIKLASGEVGYCFRDHPMSQCDRKPEERSDVGPTRPAPRRV